MMFSAMAHSKVATAKTIDVLGCDFLFKDSDVAWHNDSLTLFHDKNNSKYNFDYLFSRHGASTSWCSVQNDNYGFIMYDTAHRKNSH